MRIEHYLLDLLAILIEHPLSQYSYLAERLGVSTKTVQRYVVDLQEILADVAKDISLQTIAGKGIELQGDYEQLKLVLQGLKSFEVNEKADRFHYILMQLLNAEAPITIQQFIDSMHLS
ncbi:HTH domain-containing protein [Vaginisenegalia massiliensis]|uniref:HTH domain-containing protein n=1 Tax=Vaginisenegalia massiliensis TaxID=2058294 RepID=UPI000F54399B|nr:helix-turn-helix domain-containing protein [Vaginisenegalia massiliensis]